MTQPNTQRLYFPELDGLRFVAFMMVFIHHLPIPKAWHSGSGLHEIVIDYLHRAGWLGVDVFFALSAYLLTRLGLREIATKGALDIRHFYMRRILRIWPLYFLALFLGFFAYPFIVDTMLGNGFPSSKTVASIKDHFLPFITFLGNFSYAAFLESRGIYRSLWTISIEEQFYIILPLFLLIIPGLRFKKRLFIAAFALALAWVARVYVVGMVQLPYPWVWMLPITHMDSFIVGICIAFYMHNNQSSNVPGWIFLAITLAAFALIGSYPILGQSLHTIWQMGLAAVFSGGFLLAAIHVNWLKHVLSLSYIRYLGKISFGLYVYHRYGLDMMKYLGMYWDYAATKLGWSLLAFSALAFTVTVSALSYHFFEARFLRLKQRYTSIPSRAI